MKLFKYKISEDDTLDSISRAVSNEALALARDEMSDRITKEPNVSVVDYRNGSQTIDLDKTEKTPSGKDPYDMYSHVGDGGVISASRVTPEREQLVGEIYKDGSKTLSSREDFEKKVAAQSVSEDEIGELGRIVRVTSSSAEDYANADNRSTDAYAAFDTNKYTIEETAARRGIPPSLLSSIYFKTVADKGTITADAPSVLYAKLAYNRLYGQPLTWDDETLGEYLKTPEGVLDFIAIGLKSEAKYLGYDTGLLSKQQMSELLAGYGKWNGKNSDFGSTVMAYNAVFDDIYKKLPSKDYEVKII